MPKGTTKRRPQTLARLLDAGLRVFADAGFEGARIEDVCRLAGYTRGAFYSNFSSKDELFFALFEAHAARELGRIAGLAEELTEGPGGGQVEGPGARSAEGPGGGSGGGHGSGALTLDAVAGLLARVEPDERTWFLITTEFTLYAIRNPAAASALADHDARLRERAAPLLRGLLARAGLRLRPGVAADEVVRAVIALREGSLGQAYVEPGRTAPGELAERFLPALLASVTCPVTCDDAC
ncbi:TetR/AcrR family transcriptional regulator [Streptomyces sp. NPDC050504]|uniref:TetR/AcrR family transcriptional regulator n=1 Tax=Streptomyces sp. NPDC050504 TaxID=3365618 RepID=UPI0037B9DC84